MEVDRVTDAIIGFGIKVHSALGPGLLESTYEVCLAHELAKNGFQVRTQLALPVVYDGINLDAGYRIDMLVEDQVIVELKSIDRLMPIHEAQLISYLKLSGKKVGLLLNFNVRLLRDGIRRLVN